MAQFVCIGCIWAHLPTCLLTDFDSKDTFVSKRSLTLFCLIENESCSPVQNIHRFVQSWNHCQHRKKPFLQQSSTLFSHISQSEIVKSNHQLPPAAIIHAIRCFLQRSGLLDGKHTPLVWQKTLRVKFQWSDQSSQGFCVSFTYKVGP